jgi:large subunit ribosomal protein L4
MPTTLKSKKLDGSAGKAVSGSDRVFAAKVNTGLIHQAVQTEMTNRRQGTQSTKTRGVVHHTTRKPYKQKGTGRARQGMTSAPHYRHGGIALGPLPRDFHSDLPKKMRRAAIVSALTSKASDGAVMVTDAIALDAISTKTAASILGKLDLSGKKILLVVSDYNLVLYKSFRNIPGVVVRVAPAFSTRDIVDAEVVVFAGESLSKIEAVWGGAQAAQAEAVES